METDKHTERARAALGAAFRLVESQEDCDDKTEILRRLNLWLAQLAPPDGRRTCGRCGQVFVWPQSSRDEQFYTSRGYVAPTHCWQCRIARRAERAGQRPTPQDAHDAG